MPRRVPVVLSAVLIAAPALATDTIDSTASTGFVDLPSLNAEERAWVADPKKIPGPARMGFGRAVPVEDMVDAFAAAQWRQTPSGGHVVAVQLHSPGALGLRIGLQLSILPEASLLGFFDANGNPVAAFSGAELNVAEGPFWSPLIRGDTAILAVNLPPGDDPSTVQLSLPRVSHLLSWPFDQTDTSAATGNQCWLDATCHPDWAMASLATALLIYTEERGGTGTCTGTLLNDADPTTRVPYMLTAHHCVPDPQRAASVETFWFHRSAQCGGPPDQVQSVAGGAELLYAAETMDTSLLRLRRPPPAGAVFAGWSINLPVSGTTVASVHHLHARRQSIAIGSITGTLPCSEIPLCEGQDEGDVDQYLLVSWDQGGTEFGSSGAGLFLPSGELVGALHGGFGDCADSPGPDHYGRFDLTYRAGLYRWLGQR